MISWDIVMMLAQAELGAFVIPTLLNKHAYIPRLQSVGFVTGLAVITVTLLVGFNAPLSAAVAALSTLGWALTFILRGTAPKDDVVQGDVLRSDPASSEWM